MSKGPFKCAVLYGLCLVFLPILWSVVPGGEKGITKAPVSGTCGSAGEASISPRDAIQVPPARGRGSGPARVVVAVIDSGIDRRVPILASSVWRNPGEVPGNGLDDDHNGYVDDLFGWDFRDNDPDSLEGTPIYKHGTLVASLIVTSYGLSQGLGVILPGLQLMDLRFLDSRGLFYADDWGKLIDAIDYAVENGARIINLSVYSKIPPPKEVRWAFKRAVRKGVLVIGITGNTGDRVGYFGRLPEVVAVGAVDEKGRVAAFSGRGAEVSLFGPGENVLTWGPEGAEVVAGTSFAAAYITGIAAILLSISPDLTPDELLGLLRETASPLGGISAEAGVVDVGAAVEAMRAYSGGE